MFHHTQKLKIFHVKWHNQLFYIIRINLRRRLEGLVLVWFYFVVRLSKFDIYYFVFNDRHEVLRPQGLFHTCNNL